MQCQIFMPNFCDIFDFSSVIEEPTCFKNPGKDVTLTNVWHSFQNIFVIAMGLLDFHKMTANVKEMIF